MKLIQIKDTTGNTRPVDAFWASNCGNISIHVQRGYANYALTHVPTGHRIASMYIRGDAIKFAEQIADKIDWSFQGAAPDHIRQKYLELKISSGFEFQ
jgi:hypothetical protein